MSNERFCPGATDHKPAESNLTSLKSVRDLAEQKLDQLGRYIRGAYSCEEDDSEVPRRQDGKEKYRGL